MQKKAAKKSKLLSEKEAEANKALQEITRSMTVGAEYSFANFSMFTGNEQAER